uniref:Uncharacterized protein n=1 Tax=Meloidogyne javanica TaxID=6303 RepID=A0A915MVB0_MELJA
MEPYHPFLKRDLCRMFHSFRSIIHCRIFASSRVVQDPVYNEPSILPATRTRRKTLAALQPMDINGKPLIEDGKKDLGGAYFKQLAMSWE